MTTVQKLPTISVVICTYSDVRLDDVNAAIAESRAQLQDGDEVIVVVDHNEALLGKLSAEAGSGVIVVANQEERGLSGGRNTGVSTASGDVCVFLDDDALPAPGWLAAYRRRFADPTITGVGGAVTPAWDGGNAPRWLPGEFGWVIGCDYIGMPASGGEIRNPIGANMAIRTAPLRNSGGFAATVGRVGSLPVGCEETDLCIRLRQADPSLRIVRETGSDVAHRVPLERQTLRYFLRRCYYEGRSKGVLSARVGSQDALSAERAHVIRSLTHGAATNLRAAASGDLYGLARLVLLIVGTAVTTYGFVAVSLRPDQGQTGGAEDEPTTGTTTDSAAQSWRPLRLLDFDTASGETTPAWEPTEDRLRLLVWRDDRPVGIVELDAAVCAAAEPPTADDVLATLEDLPQPFVAPTIATTEHVTVVVPTHGRPEELDRCLRSLLNQDHPDYDVLVVDNNPAGAAAHFEVERLIADLDDPRLRLVHHPEGGSSGARNRGIAEAQGDIIAATDDDVIADRRWISSLAAVLADPKVTFVTGLVVPNGLETRAQEFFEEYGGFGKGFERRTFDLVDNRDPSPLYPFAAGLYGSGNNVAYRKAPVQALGGYDPLLGPGSPVRAGQDLDLFLAVILAGHTMVYEPAAVVRHEHRRTMDELERQLHSYGRGLAAVITKRMLGEPRVALAVLLRIPRGAYHMLGPGSERNEQRSADYPKSLGKAEIRGLREGSTAYLKARIAARRAA